MLKRLAAVVRELDAVQIVDVAPLGVWLSFPRLAALLMTREQRHARGSPIVLVAPVAAAEPKKGNSLLELRPMLVAAVAAELGAVRTAVAAVARDVDKSMF